MKTGAKVAATAAAVVLGGIGSLGLLFFYVVGIAVAPFIVFFLIGGMFMMSPATRSEFFWYLLPWLLAFGASFGLVTGAGVWLMLVWRRQPKPPALPVLPAPADPTALPDKS